MKGFARFTVFSISSWYEFTDVEKNCKLAKSVYIHYIYNMSLFLILWCEMKHILRLRTFPYSFTFIEFF